MQRELTVEQEEACASAPQFANVRAVDIFGAHSDGELARRIAAANIVRYRQLREEFEYESGIKRRPDSFYG